MILITGASGYVGSHLCYALKKREIPFIGLDIDIWKNIIPGVQWYKEDCCDRAAIASIFRKFKPSTVIHLAALKSIPESLSHPEEYFQNNINSLTNVLALAKMFNCQRIIFSSSCAVYGPQNSPIKETAPLSPQNSYAKSKAICEEIIQSSDIPYIILRYFNPIGELNGLQDFAGDGINAAIRACNVTIHGSNYPTPDGTPIRDFIPIDDLVECHIKAITMKTDTEIFNIGSGYGTSIKELLSRAGIQYTLGPRRPGDLPAIWADTSNWKKAAGE